MNAKVPWGKHQSARFRLIHNTKLGASISRKNDAIKSQNNGELDHPELPPELLELNQNVLPVVMVRDPFTWWQSMCRVRYSAHWYHVVPDHCPNFIANDVEKEWFFKKRPEVRKHYDADPWKVDNVMNKANYTLDKRVSTRTPSFYSTTSTTRIIHRIHYNISYSRSFCFAKFLLGHSIMGKISLGKLESQITRTHVDGLVQGLL